MNRIRWYGPTLVLLITVILVMVGGPSMARKITWAQQDERITLIRDDLNQSSFLSELSEAFRKVADVVEPRVVNIQVMARVQARDGMRERFFSPPQPEDFFDKMPDQRIPVPPRQEQEDDGQFDRFNPPSPR